MKRRNFSFQLIHLRVASIPPNGVIGFQRKIDKEQVVLGILETELDKANMCNAIVCLKEVLLALIDYHPFKAPRELALLQAKCMISVIVRTNQDDNIAF